MASQFQHITKRLRAQHQGYPPANRLLAFISTLRTSTNHIHELRWHLQKFAPPYYTIFVFVLTRLSDISPNTKLPIEETPVDAHVAVGQGYTESKWVSEKLLEIATEHTALKSVIVRVGQICGGPNGSWNTAEWLPSMVRSGINLRCLPIMHEVCLLP